MSAYRLSTLEIKHVIEQALLPNRCEWDVVDRDSLTLSLTNAANPVHVVCIPGIKPDTMTSSRAISALVAEARFLLSMNTVPNEVLAYRQPSAKQW